MNWLSIVTFSLIFIVVVSYLVNGYNVLAESKVLKREGKTPLVGKSFITVTTAALAELVVVLLVSWGAKATIVDPNMVLIVAVFGVGYILRYVGSYLAAWGTWAIFVNIDKRKLLKEISKNKKEAL